MNREDRRALIADASKAELHIHVEGSLEPELALDLARRHSVALPYRNVHEARAAYAFTSLQDFLDIYYAGMDVLRTRRDFHELASAYLHRARADEVRHVEMFFDPQAHTARGIPFDTVMHGLTVAAEEARGRGMTVSLILCLLRHLSEREAFETLEAAERYRGEVLGVGLDSTEIGNPPEKFRNVFAAARDMGLHLTAHAGEEGPPEYIWQALDVLGVDRIDHGNRALEDPALVARLARDRIPLTVCPLSNLKLGVVDDLRDHPLRRMLDAGLHATVNSDDPAYFGGYINDNFVQVADALDLSEDELQQLFDNSFLASLGIPMP